MVFTYPLVKVRETDTITVKTEQVYNKVGADVFFIFQI